MSNHGPENFKLIYDPSNSARLCRIELDLPDSIEFRQSNTQGTGIFTQRSFKKGEVLYEAVSVAIPNEDFNVELFLRNRAPGKQDFMFNSFVHAVKISETHRELFPYDSFMNHSCNANTAMDYPDPTKHNQNGRESTSTCNSSDSDEDSNHGKPRLFQYRMYALRDMEKDEEVNCDYTCFDYYCHGHEIVACRCQSENCYGKIGFKFLPAKKQLELLPMCTTDVLSFYLKDHPNIVLCPSFSSKDENKDLKMVNDPKDLSVSKDYFLVPRNEGYVFFEKF